MHPAPQPPTPPPAVEPTSPRGGARRLLVFVAGLLVLAWAWQVSGLRDAGRLVTNSGRAVDYVFGQRIDESTLERRRAETERQIRTEFQSRAREEIEQEMKSRAEQVPSLMTLMRLAEQRAGAALAALSPGELDRLIDERLAREGFHGQRRGGFFPPETSPRAIFGDPDRLPRLHWSVQWLVDAADEAGGLARSAVRWTLAAFAGDGYTGELLETIAIALWGTLLAVALSIPASLLGATRTLHIICPGHSATHRAVRWFSRFVVRRSFDVARGFNEIVLALILVAVLGLGPLPGVLALLIHTYGVLGKVFSESIETADPKPIDGVTSTGASWSQVIVFAVLPQITPAVASQSLLRFESNVRGATILGVVGAGGIGQLLMDKFGAYEFPEVATMMLIIIVVVTLIDLACGRLLHRLG